MRESIKTIKFTFWMTVIFLVLTYVFSVNSEIHFLAINWPWLSNSFGLTIVGGVFASMLVVLLCEIQKYLITKGNTERFIYYQSVYLYQWLLQTGQNAQDYLGHLEKQVPENLFDQCCAAIQAEINVLQNTDYATFRPKKQSLMNEYGKLKTDVLYHMNEVLQAGTLLRLATSQTQIDYLKQGIMHKPSIASDPLIKRTLEEQAENALSESKKIDDFLMVFDSFMKQKYGWQKARKEIKPMYIIKSE